MCNLRKHLQFWKNILRVTQYIAEIIEFGFKIPFIKFPVKSFVETIHQLEIILISLKMLSVDC